MARSRCCCCCCSLKLLVVDYFHFYFHSDNLLFGANDETRNSSNEMLQGARTVPTIIRIEIGSTLRQFPSSSELSCCFAAVVVDVAIDLSLDSKLLPGVFLFRRCHCLGTYLPVKRGSLKNGRWAPMVPAEKQALFS
jgi:hypothetical protein